MAQRQIVYLNTPETICQIRKKRVRGFFMTAPDLKWMSVQILTVVAIMMRKLAAAVCAAEMIHQRKAKKTNARKHATLLTFHFYCSVA
jgi:hypothetical protein